MLSGRVTIFGGTGFLGRRIVDRLAAEETEICVAVRNPGAAKGVAATDGKGKIVPMAADVRDSEAVARAVAGAGAVVNTVGLYVERGPATFEAVHGEGARQVAEQAAKAGVARLVHISGIGADSGSESRYIRARAEGERLVKKAFPGATILRPSLLFGPDDAFFSTLADLARMTPALPLFGGGEARLQPVYVGDVALAVEKALATPESEGKTFELGGPDVYTYKQLTSMMLRQTGRVRMLLPVPFALAEALASAMALLPSPPLTPDQVELMKHDNVVGPESLTLADLGIEPTAMQTILPSYLGR